MTEDSRWRGKPAVLILPVLFLYMIFTTLSILPWYTGLSLASAEFFGMHHVCFI
jgi:palmitoyltransferase